MSEDPDVVSRRIARESLDRDDPTGWFENLYAAAAEGPRSSRGIAVRRTSC